MRKVIVALLGLVLAASAGATQSTVTPNTTINSGTTSISSGSSGSLTWGTVKHHTLCNTATTASASCTISAVTAGSLLQIWTSIEYSGTGNATQAFLASVTASGETLVHCPNQYAVGSPGSGVEFAEDCYYTASAAGGETSVTANWTLAGLSGASIATNVWVDEVSYTNGPIHYDSGNAMFLSPTGCTTCTHPAGLNSGTNDAIDQVVLAGNNVSSGPGSPYTNPSADLDTTNVGAGYTGALTQSSYPIPTSWTLTGTSPDLFSFISFSGNASPQLTLEGLLDFSACTNGSAVTSTCLNSSTTAGTPPGWSVASAGANLKASTGGPTSNLPVTTTVNGVSKTGSSTLNLSCLTSGTGSSCGVINQTPPILGGPGTSMSVFYTVSTSCFGASTDCGAIGGIISNISGDYAVAHFFNGTLLLESFGGAHSSGVAYTANTLYRVNIQYNAGTTGSPGTHKMLVCADNAPSVVLGSLSLAGESAVSGAGQLETGISGEEPATASVQYYWRNVLRSNTGQMPASGCW